MITAPATTAGDISLSKRSSGADYTAQRIKWRLQFFRGEWFADQRLGVPYHRDILRKGATVDAVSAVFRKVITETPGVSRLDSFDARAGDEPRSLHVSFSCTYSDGANSGPQSLLIFV